MIAAQRVLEELFELVLKIVRKRTRLIDWTVHVVDAD